MNYLDKTFIICNIFFWGVGLNFYAQINQVDKSGRKQGEWVKNYDGDEFGHVIRYKGQFKDDKPIGKFVFYYPSKKVRAVIIHDEDGIRSEAAYYFENGELASYGIHKNEKKDSVWTNFLPSGHYSSEETYKNDLLDGLKTTFYGPEVTENQKIKVIFRKDNYTKGELNGESVEYFSDGVIKSVINYKNGRKEGVCIKNHPNGRRMLEERWKSGNKHGWWKTFDESGKELGSVYYSNGVLLEGEILKKHLNMLKEKGINPNN